MKTFTVELARTTVETATVTVEAPDKRTAGFMAAQVEPEWKQVTQSTKVGTIDHQG